MLQQLAQGDFEGAKQEVQTALEAKAQEAAGSPMPDPLPPPRHIGPGRGHKREENAPYQIRPVSEPSYGTSQTYLLRRLARDAPAHLPESQWRSLSCADSGRNDGPRPSHPVRLQGRSGGGFVQTR